MKKTVVLNVVGLTREMLGSRMPRLSELAGTGGVATIGGVMPAVTCSVQATYLTGKWPAEHGIVGNGWYFRDECEVKFWRQSNRLVGGAKVWDMAKARDSKFTCANMFWWFNQWSTADYSVTPKPSYPADGRKVPDVYTNPAGLRDELQERLGPFPLFKFWGPGSSIECSDWIAESTMVVDGNFDPTLTLVYLPHLDYGLQKWGPGDRRMDVELRAIDRVCGRLIDHYRGRGSRIMVVSEYGIGEVGKPVHLNRVLREKGLVVVREELGRELLDAGASGAFAVADHQVAHVYVNDLDRLEEVRRLIEGVPGVARVLDEGGKREFHLNHPRAGELVALAEEDAWFTYYYWNDDARAPDFARTVDIHRKPGYDPVELFVDRAIWMPKVKIGSVLMRRKLGMRAMMEVIGLDASVVKGSHGIFGVKKPVLISSEGGLVDGKEVAPTEVAGLILKHLDA